MGVFYGWFMTQKKTGRPTLYTPELAEKICELIRSGKSERNICQMDGMPSMTTLWNWKNENPEFLKLSARAREESAEVYAEKATNEAVKLAAMLDDVNRRSFVATNGETIEQVPAGFVEAKKILIQQLNREAALRDDSRFGNRKTVKVEDAPNTIVGLGAIYAEIAKFKKEAEEEN